MEFKEITAKTVDEAITKACLEFETSSDNLEIQVVQEGTSGFLGFIGSKPAVIKVRKKVQEEEFDIFWDIYHDTAGLQPVDRERAFRAWKLLDKEERFLAVGNMIPYLSLFKYKCNSAADYLTYKCFNMSE